MNRKRDRRDEAQLAALFAAADSDTLPPDEPFLDQLRERSTEVFAAEASRDLPLSPRRRTMWWYAVRALATSAAAIVAAVGLWFLQTSDDSAVAFTRVLQSVARADTVHMRITRDGESNDVWARRPHQLRWNHADGTYKIAHGARLWLVDEKANRATPKDSPYFGADVSGLDALALLGLPEAGGRESLLKTRPAQRVRRDGRELDVYHIEVPSSAGPIEIEALADVDTQRLYSIEAKIRRGGRLEPIGSLKVLAVGQPVDDSLFVVGDTLTEDGRIGKVTDVQGIVGVKPVMHGRWTPIGTDMLIKPGDWLRTDPRGANAVSVRLVGQTDVTLGPGCLVELVKPYQIRVLSGELKVTAAAEAPLEVIGPGQQRVEVTGRQFLRLLKDRLVRVEKEPLWLRGFEGSTSNESIGSLVAKIEGRNEPLTVGYHKVAVEIRDQIARTVIEESFVNHTKDQLEGEFFFPLPQDASISGFGMWIDGKLVQADIVEKQRAREIYETILRERRDPGLLEWAGGNIFKARVFPILPRSEKRIQISYTQVLPLVGSRYRYSYALQSEMLRQHPLRELAIDVKINSALPLADVRSPTHTTRTDRTKHSAHVEFAAQEYTPTRDFEVVVEVDGNTSPAMLIPHRRGGDGYFMLQLTAPADGVDRSSVGDQREVLPDGKPLELLILADTSASIDADGRKQQGEFLAALLGSLTPQDRINVAACDVGCDWVFKELSPADDENINAARRFLADRASLGWTDLRKAFASALKQCGPKTHVIYVGDGIVTGKDVDPQAFAKELRQMVGQGAGTFHAVSVGSSFEAVVLRTIASLGGGSVRQITGERGPQAVATELLGAMIRPGIRDLKVDFHGLQTARVYPEQLPNVPAGTQQILLGRYLPKGKDQTGEVVVTGTQAGKPIRMTARVSLKDAVKGNSFIPRLWARMYLDSLLQQGTSAAIQQEIIALSEEYHIITPYTSLLVLESDADRERFKVKRHFQIRDGERFFATGRDSANFELLGQQMRRAGNWRQGLRRNVLRELAALGRDPGMFQQHRERYRQLRRLGGLGGVYSADLDVPFVYGGSWSTSSFGLDYKSAGLKSDGYVDSLWFRGEHGRLNSLDVDLDGDGLAVYAGDPIEHSLKPQNMLEEWRVRDFEMDGADRQGVLTSTFSTLYPAEEAFFAKYPMSPDKSFGTYAPAFEFSAGLTRGSARYERSYEVLSRRRYPYRPAEYTGWLDTLFPHLPPAPPKKQPPEPETPWPTAARALAESLLRTGQLAAFEGGLRVERRSEYFDARWGELTSRAESLSLVSPAAWLVHNAADGGQTTVGWCNEKERGVLSKAYQLGRLRGSTAEDLRRPPLGLGGHTMASIERAYQDYAAELRGQGEDRTLLVLKHPSNRHYEIHVLIDTARHVILAIENHQDGKLTSRSVFDQFVEVAGAWWAGRIESTDKEGRRTSLVTQTFEPLATEAFGHQWTEQLAGRDRVQFLREPQVKLLDAKRALGAGKATFDDRIALLLHFARSQQWDRVFEHLDEVERLAGGKPGTRWVRDAILKVSRRGEKLKKRIAEEAGRLAQSQAGDSEEFFLAEHLRGQASGVLEANEVLTLLDRLRPVYERQAAHLHAMKRWNRQRVEYLGRTGQSDQARQLRKELASRYPHDADLQREYAQALVNAGEHDAAFDWLRRVLAEDARWLPYEEESLRNVDTQLLRSQGRYPELVDYLAAWVKRDPPGASAYQQYLAALVWVGRPEEANRLIDQWLREGRKPGRLERPVASRLQAAVSQALGQGYDFRTDRIDPRWLDPLADAVLFFALHEHQLHTADTIMGRSQFTRSDRCRQVRKTIAGILVAEISTLPADRIQRFVNWIWPNDPAVEADVWKRIAAALQDRWSAESKPEVKNELSRPLVRILSGKIGVAEHLAFLRRQLEEGPKRHRANYARELFDALLSQPWSAEYEGEAFGLLEQLSDAKEPVERLVAEVAALYQLTDRMVAARLGAEMKKVEHQEELSRTKLREKKAKNLEIARQGFSDRLREEQAKREDAAIGQWMHIERLYLDTVLGRDLDAVAEECWEFLGTKPAEPIAEKGPQRQLDDVLRNRFLLTIANLAARRDAQHELADRLLEYCDRAIEAQPQEPRWKLLRYQLLIALDRPKDLEKDLRRWIHPDEPDSRWRLGLGYLLAEQGKIAEAIQQLEMIETADELGPNEYRTLADWYMVLNRRQQHERALVSRLKTMEEGRLRNFIEQRLQPWRRSDGPLPGELDKDVLRAFQAIFEKSSRPQRYLDQLRQFYQASRDFRLLSGLADAVIGHTTGKVYPFLQGMGPVLGEIHDEATTDSMVEHLAKVRGRAKTDVDHRALDLFELLVERRCAELQNQPGPHVEKALAAMQRAFRREWSPGEPRRMTDFLAGLGAIPQSTLAEEQIRELEVLHQGQAAGTVDRLHIARRLAETHWSHNRPERAIDLLEAALTEHQSHSGGVLPAAANEALSVFVSYLEQRGHHARGEQVFAEQLQRPANAQQARWLKQRRYQLYQHALGHGGHVSLGAGTELYRALLESLQGEYNAADDNYRRAMIDRLCSICRTAHEKKLPEVADDLKAFASDQLPELLKRQTNDYQTVVRTVADTVHDLAGPRDGLAVLIAQIEREPAWFRLANRDGWREHAYRLAEWRKESKDLGELEGRLLAIVTAELRRDLESGRSHHRQMYHRHYRHNGLYWEEKEETFAKTAEEVYAEQKQSGAAVQYITDYLFHGVNRHRRAIEILFLAHNEGLLDEGGQSKLVDFLHQDSRHGESIALLQSLLRWRPDNLHYRLRLMYAYYRTDRVEELLALLKQTDEHFHKEGRWTEQTIRDLAQNCLNTHLFEQSAAYYEELIPLHQRTQPGRGIGNGTLSGYYGNLARAYAGLKNTAKAVDAACGAIVSWGPKHEQRKHALDSLEQVLRDAPDLDAYVAELDRQSAETDTQNPLVRNALGRVYFTKKEFAKAIEQLKLACELEPGDKETYQKLIACFDELQDAEGAIRECLALLQLARRDIELYKQLGTRLADLERPEQSERAVTSIVEALPNESESHAMLAEIRQQQDRWDDAMAHWQQVARIRSLEPTGLLKLAAAQIHQHRWEEAQQTLDQLNARTWPPRFADVRAQTRNLGRQLDEGRGK